jgi:anti-sigma factor RsiW
MTMQHTIHPDDERLAALVGGDPEATEDAALRAHAGECERCGRLVDDLRQLRSALAELPDLAPSRPLQLVPPVAEPVESSGAFGWLRRMAAPAMAAGAGLALVGAVGFGAVALGSMATGAGAALDANGGEERSGDQGAEAPETTSTATAEGFGASEEPVPASEGDSGDEAVDRSDDDFSLAVDLNTPTPWLLLIVAGAVLLVGGLALRYTIQPRAG